MRELARRWVWFYCQLYTYDGIKRAVITGSQNAVATLVVCGGTESIRVRWDEVDARMRADGEKAIFFAC